MKINTVNVIEYFGMVHAIHSFTDDIDGNKEAEDLFAEIAKDNQFSDADIEVGKEEGYLEDANGEYQLYIVHS